MRDIHKKIAIAEDFYSIQGEGLTTGKPSVFIRLAGCNLMCGGRGTEKDGELHNGATWRCDSIETWMNGTSKSIYDYEVKMVRMKYIENLDKGANLIFTGGEPLLQQESIVALLEYLYQQHNIKPYVEIETNGTIEPIDSLHNWVGHYNISPKLDNSGEELEKRIKLSVLRSPKFYEKGTLKIVLSTRKDFAEAMSILSNLHYSNDKIWLMPCASNREELIENSSLLIELCKKHGFNFSSRLQINVWNKTVGV